MITREPAVAGTFYPADAHELRQTINKFLVEGEAGGEPPTKVKAMIVPHAGLIYSGALAGKAYATLAACKQKIKTVVLLGPAHKVYFRGIAAAAANEFKTPLGNVDVAQDIIADVVAKFHFVQRLSQPHLQEHSLEVQLPFLQELLGDFKLVPMIVGDSRAEHVDQVIDYLWGDGSTLIIISSDLSHFHDYVTAQAMDGQTAEAIESLQHKSLNGEYACGYLPVSGLLLAARRRQVWPERVGLLNSGDTAGDKSKVVGYGAWLFREKKRELQVLSEQQRVLLKQLAEASIRYGLEQPEPMSVNTFKQGVNANMILPDYHAAAFVTLTKDGELRGCIGSLSAYRPLADDVAENAFAAAFRDPRFPPVTVDEIDEIEVSISVLSAPEMMVFSSELDLISQIRPGVDGMILTDGGHRGTFLPSVWEHYPNADSFFTHLKLKAGLPADYWSGTIKIERYKTVSW